MLDFLIKGLYKIIVDGLKGIMDSLLVLFDVNLTDFFNAFKAPGASVSIMETVLTVFTSLGHFLAAAFALCFILRNMVLPPTSKSEHPGLIMIRTSVAILMLANVRRFIFWAFAMGNTIYHGIDNALSPVSTSASLGALPDVVKDSVGQLFVTAAAGVSELVSLIFLVYLCWQIIKLMLEMAERYVTLCFGAILSPLAISMFVSSETSGIFSSFLSFMAGQMVLMWLNVISLRMVSVGITSIGTGNWDAAHFIPWYLIILSFVILAQKIDNILSRLGFKNIQGGRGGGMLAALAAGLALQGVKAATGAFMDAAGSVFGGKKDGGGEGSSGSGKNGQKPANSDEPNSGVRGTSSGSKSASGGKSSGNDASRSKSPPAERNNAGDSRAAPPSEKDTGEEAKGTTPTPDKDTPGKPEEAEKPEPFVPEQERTSSESSDETPGDEAAGDAAAGETVSASDEAAANSDEPADAETDGDEIPVGGAEIASDSDEPADVEAVGAADEPLPVVGEQVVDTAQSTVEQSEATMSSSETAVESSVSESSESPAAIESTTATPSSSETAPTGGVVETNTEKPSVSNENVKGDTSKKEKGEIPSGTSSSPPVIPSAGGVGAGNGVVQQVGSAQQSRPQEAKKGVNSVSDVNSAHAHPAQGQARMGGQGSAAESRVQKPKPADTSSPRPATEPSGREKPPAQSKTGNSNQKTQPAPGKSTTKPNSRKDTRVSSRVWTVPLRFTWTFSSSFVKRFFRLR